VRFDDGSGYSTNLVLRSAWISADYNFIFEPAPLKQFVADLEQMDRTLTGVARLKPMWEEQFLEFRCDRGRVFVCGDLVEHGGVMQRVEFQFQTDQTCLSPLINALRPLLS
jgi:hypothetical protein